MIVRFGDHEIEDEPGDEVELVALRDGERMTFVVVLEAGDG